MSNDVIIRLGDKGPHVKELQKSLHKAGYWSLPYYTETFGTFTDSAVRKFQKDKGLVIDGKVDDSTLALLSPNDDSEIVDPNLKWKDVTILGSHFPDVPIKNNVKIVLNKEIIDEYIPARNRVMTDDTKGFRLLLTIMAYKEGFRKGTDKNPPTRSYRTNNPGNIGNVDSGQNVQYGTLDNGIQRQKDYILSIINNRNIAYPIGKRKLIKPFYSQEIARNQKTYGISPYVPGYDFIFTGQLDQFVKIYSTGARAGNSYLSMIVSFFKTNGIEVNAETTLQDIIKMN